MAEHMVMKRQMQNLEAEESTERFAGLHRCDTELQSSTGMEMLKKIAADSVLHIGSVALRMTG